MVYHDPMTHKLITVMAIALAVPVWGVGQVSTQTAPPAPSAADVAQELKTLERQWVAALVNGNTKALGDILDDSYTDTDEEANQNDKNSLMAALKSGDLKMESIQLSNLKIRSYVYAAVVSGRALQNGTYKGQKLPPSVTFTDTFVMMNGAWKAVASHRSAPPAH
jgi:hypothetical protein